MTFGEKLLWRAFGLPTGILGRIGGKIMSGGRKRQIVTRVVELLDVGQDDVVLEIGFGPGVGIQYMQEAVGDSGRVEGIDPSAVMLEMASKRNIDAIKDGKVRLAEGTVEHMPFPNESFTKVFSMNSMQLWPDEKAGLQEVLRVLKPDGRLVFSFDGPARKVVTSETVRAKLNEAHFAEIEITDSDWTLYARAVKRQNTPN